MRSFVFLTFLVVACNAGFSGRQPKWEIDEGPCLPMPSPDEDQVNNILIILWTEIKDLSEQMKTLTEKTDNLQSTIIVMASKMTQLEDDLAGTSQKLDEVIYDVTYLTALVQEGGDSNDIANELQQLDEKLAEQDEWIQYIQSNVTQLYDQDEALQREVQECDVKLLELENLILFNATQLNDEDIAIQQDMQDMTQQYQQDYADVNIKISELEQEVEDNYQEFLEATYRYEISSNDVYSWQAARDYCQKEGGDLAYHGLDTIEQRTEIICNTLNWCNSGIRFPWWGLRKREGTTSTWEYVDGTLADDNDILWYSIGQKSEQGQDCGNIRVDSSSSDHHMDAVSYYCDHEYYAFCEFKV